LLKRLSYWPRAVRRQARLATAAERQLRCANQEGVPMRKLFASFFLAASLIAVPALAETLTHKVAKVSIGVPANWHSSKDGDVLTLSDKNDDVAASFVVVDSGSIKKAAKAAGKELAKKIKDLKLGKEEKININGMEGVMVDGDGRLNGKDIDLAIIVIDTPNDDKDLMIIALGEDEKIAKHKKEIKYLFDHIEPLK
jgi:hypothetical protein